MICYANQKSKVESRKSKVAATPTIRLLDLGLLTRNSGGIS